jgi:geranylgeranyl pyrophosphate synthase
MSLNRIAESTYDEAAAAIADATYGWLHREIASFVSGFSPDLGNGTSSYLMRSGKALRPILLMLSALSAGARNPETLLPACAAVEVYHNATLVHDDIIDQDELRRGKPTVWKKFGEVNAILAGDALQALAFSAAAKTPKNAAKIVAALAEAGAGVVAGQVEDIAATGDVAYIYEHKTADLFVAAAVMGALAADADEATHAKLKSFALNLGLAFQFEDDLLDGDSPYPKEKTEALVSETTSAAIAALDRLPGDTAFLRDLAQKLVGRTV